MLRMNEAAPGRRALAARELARTARRRSRSLGRDGSAASNRSRFASSLARCSGRVDVEAHATMAGGVGRTVAVPLAAGRKVRAPQGRVPGNAWAARADGKCNREQTAERS